MYKVYIFGDMEIFNDKNTALGVAMDADYMVIPMIYGVKE